MKRELETVLVCDPEDLWKIEETASRLNEKRMTKIRRQFLRTSFAYVTSLGLSNRWVCAPSNHLQVHQIS